MIRNYYEILGIRETATLDEIKKQYRKLAKKLHPDTGMENAVFMELVNEAYETLSDTIKRKEYDQKIHNTSTDYNKQFSDFNNTYYGDYNKTDESTNNNYSNTYNNYHTDNDSNNENSEKEAYDLSRLSGLKKLLFLTCFYLNKIVIWCLMGMFIVVGMIASIVIKMVAAILGLIALSILISLVSTNRIPWNQYIISSIILGILYILCDSHDLFFGILIKVLNAILDKIYIILIT